MMDLLYKHEMSQTTLMVLFFKVKLRYLQEVSPRKSLLASACIATVCSVYHRGKSLGEVRSGR